MSKWRDVSRLRVPQGSVLGPLVDVLWQSVSLKHMRMRMSRNYIFSFKPDSSNSQREAIKVIEEFIAEVRIWMVAHRLLINDTEWWQWDWTLTSSYPRFPLSQLLPAPLLLNPWSVPVIWLHGLKIICLWILMLSEFVVCSKLKLFVAKIPSGK